MSALIALGLAAGLDNFRVGVGLGLLQLPRRQLAPLVTAFVTFELTTPLLGVALGRALAGMLDTAGRYVAPILLGAWGVTLLLAVRWPGGATERASTSWFLLGVPGLLSLDNLLAGFGSGMLEAPILLSVLVIGLTSTAIGLLGLWVGILVSRWLLFPPEIVSGCALVALAIDLLPKGP
jgi:manganese efflux pump family protein